MHDSAAICRKNKWGVGDILRGTEYWQGGSNTCEIQITAIGEKNILAKCLTHAEYESTWTLNHRKWQRIKEERNPHEPD